MKQARAHIYLQTPCHACFECDEEKETSSFSMMAMQFVESALFTNLVTAVIVINLIILGVEVSWMPYRRH